MWLDQDPVKCKGKEEDFLGLAACELWKRLLPDRASLEMLDDWMQDGYRLLEEDWLTEACDTWARVWSTLRPRFTPDMTTMDAAQQVFDGVQSLFNWCQDFQEQVEEAGRGQAVYASLGRQYCLEWAAQFRDERDSIQVGFQRTLASCLFREGRPAEAGDVLHSLVARWPRVVWSYVALADAYSHLFPGPCNLELDPERARAYLERGLTVEGLEDRDRAVLEERLALLDEGQPREPGVPR